MPSAAGQATPPQTDLPDSGPISRVIGFCHRHQDLGDVILAVVFATIAIVSLWTFEETGSQRDADAWGVVLAAGATLPLALRRRWPIPVLATVSVATWAYWMSDYTKAFDAGILVALYTTIAYGHHRGRAWVVGGFFAITSVAIVIFGIVSDEDDVGVSTLLGVVTLFTVGMVMGEAVRNRRAYQRELEDKAARAQDDAAAEADRAVAEERTRIARELHDVVAHSMSVMVVQAGAARRVLHTDAQRADQALAAIEETGRSSLTEMRRVLGILRTAADEQALAPQPTLDDFSALVTSCAEAGVEVDLTVHGSERPLGPGLELAVFRIVQEALTNVIKHSAAERADVRLTYGPDHLEVVVLDAGRGAAADPAPPGSGNGLVGMRERVELFDGSLVAGPRPGGGYQVVATIPIAPIPRRDEVSV